MRLPRPTLMLVCLGVPALGLLGFAVVTWSGSGTGVIPQTPLLPEVVEIPDRFVELSLPESADTTALHMIGTRGPPAAPDASSPSGLDPDLVGGIGGLIGSEGVQFGAGALGTRGGALGGGGTAAGLGRKGQPPAFEPLLPNTEQYTEYGVNGFVLASEDPLSTFAVDVDTASWAISARKLREGVLPPPAAVRVEEFVNAMTYGYAPPTGDAPFAVHLEAAPSPWDEEHLLVRVGLKGKVVTPEERRPVHLTFLVDVSGSMSSPDKLDLAKRALHLLVDALEPEDTVALATYAGRTARILGPTPVARKRAIHDALDELSSGGSTAMNSGLSLAYGMAEQAYVTGDENRVVVLSDGDANVGPSSHGEILETIGRYAGRGITLSTVGFGMGNYKDTLMEQLADKGDGNYAYVGSMADARRVFCRDLAGTLLTIARDVKIQVAFDPEGVRAYRLLGYENRDVADRDFRNDAVDAGEVGSGHAVTAIYVVEPTGVRTGSLATVRVRAKPPGPDAPAREWTTTLAADAVRPSLEAASRDFQVAVLTAAFAERLRRSPYATDVRFADLRRRARDLEGTEDLVDLLARAEVLFREVAAR